MLKAPAALLCASHQKGMTSSISFAVDFAGAGSPPHRVHRTMVKTGLSV